MNHKTDGVPDHSPTAPRDYAAARRVLLVDDNEIDAEIVRALVRRMPEVGWELHWAASLEEGLSSLAAHPVDIVLVDYWLGDHTGADFIRQARASGCSLPMIVVTAVDDPANDWRVFLAGAAAFVPKDSLTSEVLERTIRYALREARSPSSGALSGFACICVDCRRLRDAQERWRSAVDFLEREPEVSLSHGLCPQCFEARIVQMPASPPPTPD